MDYTEEKENHVPPTCKKEDINDVFCVLPFYKKNVNQEITMSYGKLLQNGTMKELNVTKTYFILDSNCPK